MATNLVWSLVGTLSMLPTVSFGGCPTSQYIMFVVFLLNSGGIFLYLYIAQKKQSQARTEVATLCFNLGN